MKAWLVLLFFCTCLALTAVDVSPLTMVWGSNSVCGNCQPAGMVADKTGNIYVTGYFRDQMMWADSSYTAENNSAIYVTKLSPEGEVVWIATADGLGDDFPMGITLGKDGKIYICGNVAGTISFGAITLTMDEGSSAQGFVASLSPQGKWQNAALYTSKGDMEIKRIATAPDGNLVVMFDYTGEFKPLSVAFADKMYHTYGVGKLSPSLKWVWAEVMESEERTTMTGMHVDATGNIYVCGSIEGDIRLGGKTLQSTVPEDAFYAKLSPTGAATWLRAVPAVEESTEMAKSISTDAAGNVYLTGYFDYAVIAGRDTLQSAGSMDVFTAKCDATGKIVWMKTQGGESDDVGYAVKADAAGNVYVYSMFTDYAYIDDTEVGNGNYEDVLLTKYDKDGNALWYYQAGGYLTDYPQTFLLMDNGDIVLDGYFTESITFDSEDLTGNDAGAYEGDTFVAKLSQPAE